MKLMYEIVQHYVNDELVRERVAKVQIIETLGDTVRGIDEHGIVFSGKTADYYPDKAAAEKAMQS